MTATDNDTVTISKKEYDKLIDALKMVDKNRKPSCDDDALQRILRHAEELQWKDYIGRLADWQREYDMLMVRKPK